MAIDSQKDLFSLLISEIKGYTGEDPLRPWLRGIKKMQESLPPQVLKEKLPRFLQKCAQTFESDRRYRNDPRYLGVWIQLMDYVDDAKVVLRKMEKQKIGLKWASFYIAYALYYEKRKKFEHAEKMYHLGVQILAEPAGKLQKSYEQFLHRVEMCKKRKTKLQEAISITGKSTCRGIPFHKGEADMSEKNATEGVKETKEHTDSKCHIVGSGGASQIAGSNTHVKHDNINVESINIAEGCSKFVEESYYGSKHHIDLPSTYLSDVTSYGKGLFHHTKLAMDIVPGSMGAKKDLQHQGNSKPTAICNDDTVVVKFVGSAIVGKSQAEDACHHGLVDPTINMKDAMHAISSMFREPLEPEPIVKRRSNQSKPKENQLGNGFEVFIDESPVERKNLYDCKSKDNVQNEHHKLKNPESSKMEMETELHKPFVAAFEIYADDEEDECADGDGLENGVEGCKQPTHSRNSSICSKQNGINHTSCKNPRIPREDTVIRRFVGSTIFSEPKVENACHHGLVDPTVNLKEVMDDINNMFGRPLDFVKANKPKKKGRLLDQKPNSHSFTVLADEELEEVPKGMDQKPVFHGLSILADDEPEENSEGTILDLKLAGHGFSILADDDIEEDSKSQASSYIPCKSTGEDSLSEPTLFTKEALADINEMFGRPLDF